MNKPSSTITVGTGAGAIASVLMGLLAVFFPDIAGRVPTGFEGALATVVIFWFGYRTPETVLRERFSNEQIEDLP